MISIARKMAQTGLDIGNSSVKFVQLSGKRENPILKNFELIKLKEGNTDEYREVLANIAKKLTSKDVNISISGPQLVVRYVDLPKMNEEELKSSMKFQAGEHIPFDIKDVIIDCQKVEDIEHGKMKVLLVAVKKETIDKLVKLVEGTGIFPGIIDCDSFALTNAFLLNFPDAVEGTNVALLGLGEKYTVVNIMKGKTPSFTRELQIGGRDFAQAISEKLDVNIKAASLLKEEPGERLQQILEITKPIIVHMVEEVKLSLTYYENQIGSSVDKIYLSGGLSGFKGLEEIFKKSLETDCGFWDPFKRIKIDKGVSEEKLNSVKNQLHVAVGLALRY
ncbi:MAG: type IV pilus assembly protein PilM [Candidatus Omnitrophica bacterium]|nr:type IV pilus assembly protein PilM [Candidatus Omnitrophota bacterium]